MIHIFAQNEINSTTEKCTWKKWKSLFLYFMKFQYILTLSVQSDNLHAVTINCTVGIPFSLKHSIDSE